MGSILQKQFDIDRERDREIRLQNRVKDDVSIKLRKLLQDKKFINSVLEDQVSLIKAALNLK